MGVCEGCEEEYIVMQKEYVFRSQYDYFMKTVQSMELQIIQTYIY